MLRKIKSLRKLGRRGCHLHRRGMRRKGFSEKPRNSGLHTKENFSYCDYMQRRLHRQNNIFMYTQLVAKLPATAITAGAFHLKI